MFIPNKVTDPRRDDVTYFFLTGHVSTARARATIASVCLERDFSRRSINHKVIAIGKPTD